MKHFIFILSLFTCVFAMQSLQAAKYVVLVTSGNNEAWIKKHITSVFEQDFDDFRVVWVDDASSDRTSAIMQEEIKNHPRGDLVTYVRNDFKSYQASCTYQAVHNYINDDEVIIFLDGDDWFIHSGVISKVDEFYTKYPETWMATSRLKRSSSGEIVPKYGESEFLNFVARDRKNPKKVCRTQFIRCNALRTCRAWLYKLIDKEYLMMEGKFVSTSGDISYLYPMFCMSGTHYRFIDEVLYLHNNHPNNDEAAKRDEQLDSCIFFLQRIPYKRLQHDPNSRCMSRSCRVCEKYGWLENDSCESEKNYN